MSSTAPEVAAPNKPAVWTRLLEGVRPRPSSTERPTLGMESLSDKSRILASAAFRRLQSKAQVFSLARGGDVRTRLTHSIEVSNYGELIAESVSAALVARGSLPEKLRIPFVQTVENACLLHDIGNPPFGHMGEYAIARWFSEHEKELVPHWVNQGELPQKEAQRLYGSFKAFDGNPQGLRIVTRLQWLSDEHGLNLTCALIGAYLKYLGDKIEPGSRLHKKIGFFPSETKVIQTTWEKLGLRLTPEGLPAQRHPLAYIMEAADDIAFCLSDIEDAIQKRLITEAQFLDEISHELPNEVQAARAEAAKHEHLALNGAFHFFRLALSARLVKKAADVYLAGEDEILFGEMKESLLRTDEWAKYALAALQDFSAARIYTARETVEIELSGLAAITGILDEYLQIMRLTRAEFERLGQTADGSRFHDHPVSTLLYSLLPSKQMQAYRWQTETEPKLEPVHRTQLIVDYVSGMTDSHALKIFNMVSGHLHTDVE